MSGKVIYLLVDTNLFIQCRSLTELGWEAWKGYSEIQLIVTRPVQREIDSQKSKGKGRVNQRARQTASLFKSTITSSEGFTEIRSSSPRVILCVCPEYLPDPSMNSRLEYSERDDQLVGTVSSYMRTNPGHEAKLLTHDSGPIASAKMVGVPFEAIPDEWLLDPESPEAEKRIRNLESQIVSLKSAEPGFEFSCVNSKGEVTSSLEFNLSFYEALSDSETRRLMEEIRAAFPIQTDFGPRETAEREKPGLEGFSLMGLREIYEPADEAAIAGYRDDSYPTWLKKCEESLRSLHTTLNSQVTPLLFGFAAKNNGSRPAKDALITIEALGSFALMPCDYDDLRRKQLSVEGNQLMSALPKPPAPPKGSWQVAIGKSVLSSTSMRDALKALGVVPTASLEDSMRLSNANLFVPEPHDPNAFYYKQRGKHSAARSFSLTCDQWRHGIEPEEFWAEIKTPHKPGEIAGAARFEIHAENLSKSQSLLVPVRIAVSATSPYPTAQALVRGLSFREISL